LAVSITRITFVLQTNTMITATKILSQGIEIDIYQPCIGDYRVRIVHSLNVLYSDNRERLEEEVLSDFGKYFSSKEDAERFINKDKFFKATLKAAIKYTKFHELK
jgi:LPS O-antigen subunit length determinant protein (WzzB/FepE family)